MALLQVLIVSAVIAGMAAMILRVSLSRTVTARQNRRTVSAQMLIENCMAEVNTIWASKTPEEYADDLAVCRMYRDADGNSYQSYTCLDKRMFHFNVHANNPGDNSKSYNIEAQMSGTGGNCQIKYIVNDSDRFL